MTPETKKRLRTLPSVDTLLDHQVVREWLSEFPRRSVLQAVQHAIQTVRQAMIDGRRLNPVDPEELLAFAERELLDRSLPSLRAVINATGIILHTGLGRAPLYDGALEAVMEAGGGYCNLEYDLATGRRGFRQSHVMDLLTTVTGAQCATVVNNNAAATLLILQTFAAGREVVVSRGQLVEIGGSFRLPDIMGTSGAALREVGTTNRTRITDYERAIHDRTAMLLHVHPSNFRVVGFCESVSVEAMADLAHRRGLIAVDDLGSGALFDLTAYGLPAEPSVGDSLQSGADLVCFSGDKLLGGPQCGLIVGKKDLIHRIESNPLMRTYRTGKLTLLALEATLHCYLDPDEALSKIPTLAMLGASTEELAERAKTLAGQLQAALPGEQCFVCSDVGYVGGGSMPQAELPTVVVQWRPSRATASATAAALREADTPVIVRIRDDALCFDLRTLLERDFDLLVSSVSSLWEDHRASQEPGGFSLPIVEPGP